MLLRDVVGAKYFGGAMLGGNEKYMATLTWPCRRDSQKIKAVSCALATGVFLVSQLSLGEK